MTITRPDWAAPGLQHPPRPLPTITAEALKRPMQPATAERLLGLHRRWVAPGWFSPWSDLRERAAAIRRESLADLEGHLRRLSEQVTAHGGVVHRAATPADAVRIIEEIAADGDVDLVVKSKSMATEELHLNHHLEGRGIDVAETDLGEYIVQLADERPSHIVTPAAHRSRAEITELFEELAARHLGTEADELAAFARRRLREDFHRADMGVSGVNFAAADTGTLVLLTNEGNGRMVSSQPRIHVAVMTLEKVIPRFTDLAVLLPLVTWAATRTQLSVYQTLITGPRRPGERDGPEQLHLVILDNGRSRLIGTRYEEVLACIRCGACQISCPVYRTVGGHAYGAVYGGPIGAVLTPLIGDREAGADLPFLSSLCGACADACPVKIPLPDMLVDLRADYEAAHHQGRDRVSHMGWLAWSVAWASGASYRSTTEAVGWAWRHLPSALTSRLPGRLPGLGRGWAAGRLAPPLELAGRLRAWMASREGAAGGDGGAGAGPVADGDETGAEVVGGGAGPAAAHDEADGGAVEVDGAGDDQGPGPGSPGDGNGSDPAAARTALGNPVATTRAEAAEQLCQALGRVRATGHICESAESAADLVRQLCGNRAVAIEDHPDVAGLAGSLPVVEDPWQAEVGVTGVELAVAETGTLALVAGASRPRSTSLVPPAHLAVVPFSRLVPTLAEAVERLGRLQPRPSNVALVSGISRSSDIEMIPVYGVHGPGRVDVVLYPD